MEIHSLRNVHGADVIVASSVIRWVRCKNGEKDIGNRVTDPTAADQRLLGLVLPPYVFMVRTVTGPSLKSPVLRDSKL